MSIEQYIPRYLDGTEMRVGDRVLHHDDEYGTLEMILVPGTEDAINYSMPEGGLLIVYDIIGLATDYPVDFEKVEDDREKK